MPPKAMMIIMIRGFRGGGERDEGGAHQKRTSTSPTFHIDVMHPNLDQWMQSLGNVYAIMIASLLPTWLEGNQFVNVKSTRPRTNHLKSSCCPDDIVPCIELR